MSGNLTFKNKLRHSRESGERSDRQVNLGPQSAEYAALDFRLRGNDD